LPFRFCISTKYFWTNRHNLLFITKWGSLGENDGQFDGQNDVDFYDGRVYVADYANHRIQIFDPQGNFIAKFGEGGEGGWTIFTSSCSGQ
jgi:hypothetical protein